MPRYLVEVMINSQREFEIKASSKKKAEEKAEKLINDDYERILSISRIVRRSLFHSKV